MILCDYGILRAETACIRALPLRLEQACAGFSPLPEGGYEGCHVFG